MAHIPMDLQNIQRPQAPKQSVAGRRVKRSPKEALLQKLGLKSVNEAFAYLAKLRIKSEENPDGAVLVTDRDLLDPQAKKIAVAKGLAEYDVKPDQLIYLASIIKKERFNGNLEENIEGKIDITSEHLLQLIKIAKDYKKPTKQRFSDRSLKDVLNKTNYAELGNAPELKFEKIETHSEIPSPEETQAVTFKVNDTIKTAYEILKNIVKRNGNRYDLNFDIAQLNKEIRAIGVI